MRCFRQYGCLLLLLSSAACSLFKPSDHFGAQQTDFTLLTGWPQEHHAEALAVFAAGCPQLVQKPRGASTGSGLEVPGEVWQSLCNEAALLPPGDDAQARAFFERRFVPFRVNNNGREQGLFTGYYEPVLNGSLLPDDIFKYPLYNAPPDLAGNKPYFTHAEINQGALDGRGLELVWVDDPVMRFFLQIQGSGRIHLNSGQDMLVGYADGNGQPYTSLGKIIADAGLLPKDDINFFSLRQWLYEHPDQAMELMEQNPSYVFFRPLDGAGVIGAAGVALTPKRSLAVDNRYIPYGLPLFLETALPPTPTLPEAPFQRIMIAQDTGGAIRGPVRGDIFFGEGGEAEYMAGYMKGRGSYSLLVPREIISQLAPPP